MLARVAIKPTTDIYSGVSTSGLYGQELPLVRVATPGVDTDPNTAGLLPSNARVLQWPNYGNVLTGIGVVSILGGTLVTGRFWIYDTSSAKWLAIGNLVTSTTGAAQGNFATTMRSKRLYWQSTVVTGVVTDLFYGIV
jgi:hypothetical protein